MSLCTPSPCLDKPVAWIYTSPCGPPSCWGRRARCSPCWGRARPSCSSTGPRQRWAHPPLSVSVNMRLKYFSWVFTCLQRGHVLRLADQHSLIEFWPTLTDAKNECDWEITDLQKMWPFLHWATGGRQRVPQEQVIRASKASLFRNDFENDQRNT